MLFDSFLCNYVALNFFGKIYAFLLKKYLCAANNKGFGCTEYFQNFDGTLRNYLGVINK